MLLAVDSLGDHEERTTPGLHGEPPILQSRDAPEDGVHQAAGQVDIGSHLDGVGSPHPGPLGQPHQEHQRREEKGPIQLDEQVESIGRQQITDAGFGQPLFDSHAQVMDARERRESRHIEDQYTVDAEHPMTFLDESPAFRLIQKVDGVVAHDGIGTSRRIA